MSYRFHVRQARLLTQQKATLTRYGKGEYVQGVYEQGNKSCIEIRASIQPITGHELMSMPEGERTRSHFNVFTTTKLKNEDLINYKGKVYEVRTVEDWDEYSLGKAVLKDV